MRPLNNRNIRQIRSTFVSVLEQVVFSLSSFVVLGFTIYDKRVENASLELASVSGVQLPITFLAIIIGWSRTGNTGPFSTIVSIPIVFCSTSTFVWSLAIFLILGVQFSPEILLESFFASAGVTVSVAIRWIMIRQHQYGALVISDLFGVIVLVVSAHFLFGTAELPVFAGYTLSRLAFAAIMLGFVRNEENAENQTTPYTFSRQMFTLALLQYFRHNGIVPLAAFLLPEQALVIGRATQLFGNLVRMAVSPLGNLFFFGNAISQSLLLGSSGAAAASAALLGAVAGPMLLQPTAAWPWALIPISTVLAYLFSLYCRKRQLPKLAVVSELGSLIVICMTLLSSHEWIAVFPAALIGGDLMAALIVFLYRSQRSVK